MIQTGTRADQRLPNTFCTVSATFSGVKPKYLNSAGAGADSPKVSMPTTAAQPYFHQPSLFNYFGFTPENVADTVQKVLGKR